MEKPTPKDGGHTFITLNDNDVFLKATNSHTRAGAHTHALTHTGAHLRTQTTHTLSLAKLPRWCLGNLGKERMKEEVLEADSSWQDVRRVKLGFI